jgi:uncharacterized protein (TIGR03663 family)
LANPPPKVRWTVFAVLALLAFAIRIPQLGERPMHTDEAINGYITGDLLRGDAYHYDPQDRHGPTLYAIARPIARLLGAKTFPDLTETQLRLGPVLVGSLTVLLFGAAVEMFGFIECVVAATLFAFAPLPLYYNRYFIHETLFVAATFGLILSLWRALETNSVLAAALAGFCAGLMLATKETCVIHFAALGIAAVAFKLARPRNPTGSTAMAVAAAAVAFVLTVVLLFTWFGQNWHGIVDIIHAVPSAASRAGGQGHEKPPWYYVVLLYDGWSGAPFVALAVIGLGTSVLDSVNQKKITAPVFVGIYAVGITLIYTLIPYKTPWLALNFWLPMCLFIGVAIMRLAEMRLSTSARRCLLFAGVVLAAAMARDVAWRVFKFPVAEKNPYAYAHTLEGLLGLPPRLEQLARQEKLAQPLIAVVAADPWPLPWYLRKFSRVGFWQPGQDAGSADFFITSPEAADELGDKLKGCRPEYFGARPEVVMILWVPASEPASP